ncbi:unnamed protein product [Rhizoctonia solani]|uniref:Uncharacterized protein n=1 Tax=Rhizoctonia solani TaxID=456999 RepID=A0A8H3CW40_9AGAM|nr:unnamed protein product [Rhizoctonia solani]CAE6498189.1 unnamed protein product [Rhizoctonia solani]
MKLKTGGVLDGWFRKQIHRLIFGARGASLPPTTTPNLAMSKHHPDLIMCRRQTGTAIGRLCEKCDGKWWVINIIITRASGIYKFSPAAQFVTPTSDLKLLCASVMNVTLAHMAAGVLFVDRQEFPTPTTAPNVRGSRKIVMAVPRLSTLAPVERISSTRDVV